MKIRPLHDRVVVRRMEEERTTAGGIVIPDAAAEKPNKGRVISVGTGRLTQTGVEIPPEVKSEEIVLFSKHAGQQVKINGEEFLILTEDDIMAIVEE
jgi:chaperonin GroES